MRMAMIKHEETFREQVSELHRLYEIQKILMKNLEQNPWSLKSTNALSQSSKLKLDLERPADEYIAALNRSDRAVEILDESEIELTLGPSCYSTRRKKPSETPSKSDSPSFSSSSTGSSHINRTSKIRETREESAGKCVGGRKLSNLRQVPEVNLGCQIGSNSNNSTVNLEDQLRQERLKQPPWFFQVLSLNMT